MVLNQSLNHIKSFPALIWLYLIGTFLNRGAYFMVWPFLAVILHNQFGLSATNIGLILSTSAIGSALVGFYVGNLSDRFGRRPIMLIGGFIGVIAFSILAVADHVSWYAIAISLSAISRSLWEPTSKALIGDLLPSSSTRELALQLGYFSVNVGAAIGPLIGIWLGLTAQQETFSVTAAAYLALTVSMYLGFRYQSSLLKRQQISEYNFLQTIRLLLTDHLFLMLIVANIFMMFVYAHSESSLIQYLTQSNTPRLLELITAMIFTNSVTIVIFQFPLLAMMRNLTIHSRIYFGLVLLLISQVIFIYSPTDGFWIWIFAMFILSLGEAILFPSMNIQIDQLAHPKFRGSYFGATSFYTIGFASAPFIGGVLIDQYGGPTLYLVTTMVVMLTIGLYLIAPHLKRPNFEKHDKLRQNQVTKQEG